MRKVLILLLAFISISCVAGPGPEPQKTVTLIGWFNVVWGDPLPESRLPPRIEYSVTDDNGKHTVLLIDEKLINQAGGIRLLSRSRVKVIGIPHKEIKNTIRVSSIVVENAGN